jgi:UDP-N-acetylmuramoylalanine--D-glutamate ligase
VATSSFQLEGIQQFNPKVVVFLNLSEDHLNRYPNYETYLAANREVLKNVSEETLLVYNAADAQVSAFCQQLPAKKITFSSQPLADGVDGASYTKSHLFVNVGKHKRSFNLSNFRLRGPHNRENLMAAAIVATHFGVKQESIFHVIDNVTALAHRVEFVKRVNNVAFYNDACGANPQAVIRTLQSFHEPVILISGGRDKNAEYAPISSHIRQRVKNLILAGEAKEKMNRALGDFTETFLVGTLEEAVILAYQKSRSGEVILFSPAADATDQFPSHEARGEYFKKLVGTIGAPRRPNVI